MSRQSAHLVTREKLLDRGVELLMAQGYHGSGLQTILGSIGVPKGSFYHYFPSKEAFSAEVIRHYIEPFIRRLDGWLERPELDACQALKGYFRELIEESAHRQFRGGCLLGNLMGEVGDTSELCRQALQQSLERYRDRLRDGIARGQREGLFRRDLAAEWLADILVNGWQGALLRMKIEQSAQPLQQCVESLLDDYLIE